MLMKLTPGELDVVEEPVFDGSLAIHFVHLLVRKAFAHRRQQLAESILVNDTLKKDG